MILRFASTLNGEVGTVIDYEYADCISDLIGHELVRSMENYTQHGGVDCLAHSLYVSYTAYSICKQLGLDRCSAARGGLLHDFFLYDWHEKNHNGRLHGFSHPGIALRNADQYFFLNDLEREIIRKHMWPLTIMPPIYAETYIVLMVDKYCAFMETVGFGKDFVGDY